jgi:tetratricopeptide (TPR) repeat protein
MYCRPGDISGPTAILKNFDFMESQNKQFQFGQNGRAFALLFFLVFLIYSNTFHASWHLDDYHNILENPWLKIKNLQPQSIFQTFYASFDRGLYSNSQIYRPVACLTFALNWYFGQSNPFGYHLVNIAVHFITAFMLFLTILALFESPNLRGKYKRSEYFIALLAAVLWAINPIQTQAVTYIVQRMASMAAMFYIAGIYFYIKARLDDSRSARIVFYLGCCLAFIFALGSKENAVLLPVSLILVEFIFFRDLSRPHNRKAFFAIIVGGAIIIGVVGALLFFNGKPLSVLNYSHRPFTPLERLLTESRIVVFYLSQIFYPVATRLSIEHDIPISTSIIQPWSTPLGLIAVLLLIGIGLWQMRKRPVLSFVILFFFLNHTVESTIIGLELAFEHRNYLPSLFLFFPVAMGLKWLLDYYRGRKTLIYHALLSFVALLILGLGFGTYVRNMAWATEKSLWEDAVAKAPNSGRSLHNLAWGHFERIGRYDQAMQLYQKSLTSENHSKARKTMTLNNIANLYYLKKNYKKAAELWRRAFDHSPEIEFVQFRLALALAKLGDLIEASTHLNNLIEKNPERADYNFLKGSILLKQKRYNQALSFFRRVLKQNPGSEKALVKTGVALNLMEEYQHAELFLKDAHIRAPKDSSALLWLVATNLALADTADADHYLNKLIASVPINQLKSILDRISDSDDTISSRRELLIPVISGKLREKFEALALAGDQRTGHTMYSDFSESEVIRQHQFAIKP